METKEISCSLFVNDYISKTKNMSCNLIVHEKLSFFNNFPYFNHILLFPTTLFLFDENNFYLTFYYSNLKLD